MVVLIFTLLQKKELQRAPSGLLKHGASLSFKNLLSAAGGSDKEKEKEKEAKAETVSGKEGDTRLHAALRSGMPSSKFSKLAKKINIDDRDDKQQTALHIAAAMGKCEHIKILLKRGASINLQDMNGWTALHHATCEAQLGACCILLDQPGIDVSKDNKEKTSVLHYLVRQKPASEEVEQYLTVLRQVATKGIDINTRNKHGEAPLHSACMKGNEIAINFLLEKGADVNLETDVGETSLHYIVRLGHTRLAQMLMEHGADPTIASGDGSTAVDLSEQYNFPEILAVLEKYIKSQIKVGSATETEPLESSEGGTTKEQSETEEDSPKKHKETTKSSKKKKKTKKMGFHEGDPLSTFDKRNLLKKRSTSAFFVSETADEDDSPDIIQGSPPDMSARRHSVLDEEMLVHARRKRVGSGSSSNMSRSGTPDKLQNSRSIEKTGKLKYFHNNEWLNALVSLNNQTIIVSNEQQEVLETKNVRGATISNPTDGSKELEGHVSFIVHIPDGSTLTFSHLKDDSEGMEWKKAIKRSATQGLLQRRLSTLYEKLKDRQSPQKKNREIARRQAYENLRIGLSKILTVIGEEKNSGEENELADLLITQPEVIAAVFCEIVSVDDDEALIDALVTFYEEHNRTIKLLRDAISYEIHKTKDSSTMFREMGLATKLFSVYTGRSRGKEYLEIVLKPIVDEIVEKNECLEVNPQIAGKSTDVKWAVERIITLTQRLLDSTTSKVDICPVEFREAMEHAQKLVSELYPIMSQAIVGGFIFLRFLCPALVAPHVYGLRPEPVPANSQRALILLSKILISVANGVEFDGSKEDYMVAFNPVIQRNRLTVQIFYEQLTNPQSIKQARARRTSLKNVFKEPDSQAVLSSIAKISSYLASKKDRIKKLRIRQSRLMRTLSSSDEEHQKNTKESEVSVPKEEPPVIPDIVTNNEEKMEEFETSQPVPAPKKKVQLKRRTSPSRPSRDEYGTTEKEQEVVADDTEKDEDSNKHDKEEPKVQDESKIEEEPKVQKVLEVQKVQEEPTVQEESKIEKIQVQEWSNGDSENGEKETVKETENEDTVSLKPVEEDGVIEKTPGELEKESPDNKSNLFIIEDITGDDIKKEATEGLEALE